MARLYSPEIDHSFNQGGVEFINGAAATTSAAAIAKFAAAGYEVDPDNDELSILDLLTLAQVQALCKEYDIETIYEEDEEEIDYTKKELVQMLNYSLALKCAKPVASPAAGEVANPTNVSLSTKTIGATIYYTTNGSTPTDQSTEYTEPIAVTVPVTIKAIAILEDYIDSDILTAAYTIEG